MITLTHLADIVGARTTRIVSDEPIKRLLTDSRSFMNPHETLFIALVTSSGNGHTYIDELYQKGQRNFLISQPDVLSDERYAQGNFIVVPDTLEALRQLSIHHRKSFNMPVIGITGSNGKTIVKEFVYQLLRDNFHIVRSPKSFNSQLGVPLSVWTMDKAYDLAIFEAGISKPDEMARLEEIIKPNIVIFTGIGHAHQENFRSLEDKIEEKLKLAQHAQAIIYNDDQEPAIGHLIAKLPPSVKRYQWSKTNPQAFLFVSNIEQTASNTQIAFTLDGQQPTYRQNIPFTDKASVEDTIHALTTIALLKRELLFQPDLPLRLKPVEMRLEIKNGYRGNAIINDSYSNDLMSLEVALDFLQRRSKASDAESVVILSDIYESGLPEESLYHEVALLLQRFNVQHLLAVGPQLALHRRSFGLIPKTRFYNTTTELLRANIIDNLHAACILIKGARRFMFETISERLVKQLHQTTLEVDLTAIRQNLSHFRSLIPPKCKMVCMIKAEGYGLGAFEMARTLEEAHIDYLAVAVADEGKYLRRMGIKCPIMVMNPDVNSWSTLISYRLEPEIYSLSLLHSFCEALDHHQVLDPYPIHIKCDTGMHRLGFMPSDLDKLCKELTHRRSITIASIFSHLAGADDPALDSYTEQQIATFQMMAQKITQSVGYKPLWHILNTAGIERFSEYHFDMVRLGIGVYGIDPVNNQSIHPAVKLTTTILQIKELAAGEHIGYSCKGIMQHAGRIAIIPIGYADGFSRKLSNGALSIYIDGVSCPTIGNICMDTTMLDVTNVPRLREGDRITLFGSPELPVQTIAKLMDTIPYEVLTGLSPRIQRIYYQE